MELFSAISLRTSKNLNLNSSPTVDKFDSGTFCFKVAENGEQVNPFNKKDRLESTNTHRLRRTTKGTQLALIQTNISVHSLRICSNSEKKWKWILSMTSKSTYR